jgi:hypothetical protein
MPNIRRCGCHPFGIDVADCYSRAIFGQASRNSFADPLRRSCYDR